MTLLQGPNLNLNRLTQRMDWNCRRCLQTIVTPSGTSFRHECSGQLFKSPRDAAVKAEFARARQVLGKAVRRASSRFRVNLIRSLNCNPKHCPGEP